MKSANSDLIDDFDYTASIYSSESLIDIKHVLYSLEQETINLPLYTLSRVHCCNVTR